jgi:hypothetical protein
LSWDFSIVEMRIAVTDRLAEAARVCVEAADRMGETGVGMLTDRLFTFCSMNRIAPWQAKCGDLGAKLAFRREFSGPEGGLPGI